MNEDYLWDKTGEADPEVERLERALSNLRYRRPVTPLPLPASLPRPFRRNFSPALAIAATLVILLLAGGLWFALQRTKDSQWNPIASGPPPTTGPVDTTGGSVVKNVDEQLIPSPTPQSSPTTTTSTTSPHRINRSSPNQQQRLALASATSNAKRRQREQQIRGEEAKAQLIMALHIASDKLNTVQKKIQGNQGRGPIS
ncbi:MAG TPA: hypothetical protein VF791_02085 [Pyrinomonadaceae bacterium]